MMQDGLSLVRSPCLLMKYQHLDAPTRSKEWLVLWANGAISFFRRSQRSRRYYLESAGWWEWQQLNNGGQAFYLHQFACAPSPGIRRRELQFIRRGPFWPRNCVSCQLLMPRLK